MPGARKSGSSTTSTPKKARAPKPPKQKTPRLSPRARSLLRDLDLRGYLVDPKVGAVGLVPVSGGWAVQVARGPDVALQPGGPLGLSDATRAALQVLGADPGPVPPPEGDPDILRRVERARVAIGARLAEAAPGYAGSRAELDSAQRELLRAQRDLVPARRAQAFERALQRDQRRWSEERRRADGAVKAEERRRAAAKKKVESDTKRAEELAQRKDLHPSTLWADQFWAAVEVLHPKVVWTNQGRDEVYQAAVRLWRAHKLRPNVAAQMVATKCEVPTDPPQGAPIEGEGRTVLLDPPAVPRGPRGAALRPVRRPELQDRLPARYWQLGEHWLSWVTEEGRYLHEGIRVQLLNQDGSTGPREDWDRSRAVVDYLVGDEQEARRVREALSDYAPGVKIEEVARPSGRAPAVLGGAAQVAAAPACTTGTECGYQVEGGVCTISARLTVADLGSQRTERIPARYCLVEVEDLLTSNDPLRSYEPTAGYPPEAQERDYRLQGEQRKVQEIADDFQPDLVFNTAPGAIDGVPVADKQRRVLGGNGRTMATRLVYAGRSKSPADAPKQYLLEHAHEFGLTPGQVEGFRQPMLVRTVEVPDQPGALALWSRRLNTSLSQQLDATRLAVSRARYLDAAALRQLAQSMEADDTLAAYLSSPRSRSFVRALQDSGVIDGRAAAVYLQPDGLLNEAGRDLVVDLLVALLIPDAQLIQAYGRGPGAVLARGAPYLALAAQDPPFDLAEPLRKAVQDRVSQRAQGLPVVKNYLGQRGLFSRGAAAVEGDARGILLLYTLAALDGSPRKFESFARSYNRMASGSPSAQSGFMFGAAEEKRAPLQALREAAESAGVDLSGVELPQGLAQPPEPAPAPVQPAAPALFEEQAGRWMADQPDSHLQTLMAGAWRANDRDGFARARDELRRRQGLPPLGDSWEGADLVAKRESPPPPEPPPPAPAPPPRIELGPEPFLPVARSGKVAATGELAGELRDTAERANAGDAEARKALETLASAAGQAGPAQMITALERAAATQDESMCASLQQLAGTPGDEALKAASGRSVAEWCAKVEEWDRARARPTAPATKTAAAPVGKTPRKAQAPVGRLAEGSDAVIFRVGSHKFTLAVENYKLATATQPPPKSSLPTDRIWSLSDDTTGQDLGRGTVTSEEQLAGTFRPVKSASLNLSSKQVAAVAHEAWKRAEKEEGVLQIKVPGRPVKDQPRPPAASPPPLPPAAPAPLRGKAAQNRIGALVKDGLATMIAELKAGQAQRPRTAE